jgi:signal transduction histidine kinase
MDELREAVAVSDRAAATKSEFLARMSHELRTPLNAVIGYSQLLREEAIEANDPHMREDVERIHEAGTYLLRLVNMILDLSKLEARRIQFNVLQHEVGSIAQRAAAAKRELVGDRGNLVCFDLDAGLGPVFVDANRLQQVLEALVENAAQHTSAGTITVRTRAAVLGDDRAFAVSVEDTGAGIEAAVLPDLFRTFSTPRDAASASRYGGTGLNLTVVHHMCRAMGGGVEVESERGKGTVFTVTLPYDGRRVVRQRSEQRRAA